MDPAQPTNETDELKKLEEELKTIGSPNAAVPPPPPATEMPPTPPMQPAPQPKSPKILMMAIGLLVLSLVGVSAYFLGASRGASQPTPTPYVRATPSLSPTPTGYTCPTGEDPNCDNYLPNAGVRLECTPEYQTWAVQNCPVYETGAVSSPSASPTATPKVTPTATPSATPGY